MDNKLSQHNAPKDQPKVVHEALDERQFVRTKLPVKLIVTREDNHKLIAETGVEDVSLGGLAFIYDGQLELGTLLDGLISLSMQALELRIDVKLKVVCQKGNKYGCQFVELEATKCDILRYLISSYISGDIVDISGLFNIMQRENYIKTRKTKDALQRTVGERLKAILGTAFFGVLGILSIIFIVYKSYMLFFSIIPSEAVVSADIYTISMPETGYLRLLLKPGQTSVVEGEPLLNVSTQLATRFTSPADMQVFDKLTAEETNALLAKTTVETVINSPCDCDVFYAYPTPKGFSYKEAPLLYLAPKNHTFYVKATLPYSKLSDLNKVQGITLTIPNSDKALNGKIIRSQIDDRTQSTVLFIQPDRPLPKESFQQPVAVTIFVGSPFSFLGSLYE